MCLFIGIQCCCPVTAAVDEAAVLMCGATCERECSLLPGMVVVVVVDVCTYLHQRLDLKYTNIVKPGVVIHTCDSSIQEVELGGSEIQD